MPDSAKHANESQILVLSGPSGSGKTTVVERLILESSVPLVKSISATTRPQRKGEVDGVAYYFLSADEFLRRRDQGEFLETAEVFGAGYWYGTLKSEIDRAKAEKGWAFLEVDVEGALKIMALFPHALTIFCSPRPSKFASSGSGLGRQTRKKPFNADCERFMKSWHWQTVTVIK